MIVVEDYREMIKKGNWICYALLAIGIGALLGAIVQIREFTWEDIYIGTKVILILSLVIIASSVVLRLIYHHKAQKIRERWI